MSKRPPRFEDCLRMERFTGGDYCEKKNLLCYASDKSSGIILKDINTGKQKKITAGGRAEGNPSFSPDGEFMLFLSAPDKNGRQIYIYDLGEDKVSRLTHSRGSVSEPIWSPDGKWILFSSTVSQEAPQKQHPDEAFVIEDLYYKFDGRGYIPPDGRQQLYIVSAAGGELIRITDDKTDYLHANWAPDGRSVVCVSDRFREKKENLGYDLILIENLPGAPCLRRLSENCNVVSYPNPLRPVFTPDGRSVITGVMNMESDGTSTIGYPEIFLWKFDTSDGEGIRIFEPDENCYQCVQFAYNAGCGWGMERLQVSDDGKYVYFFAGWQGQCCLYRLRLSEAKRPHGSLADDSFYPVHAEKVLGGKAVHHGIGKIQNGKMLISRAEPDVPEAYCILDITEEKPVMKRVAQSCERLLEEVEFVRPEDFSVPTLDGESRIHGWVLAPSERSEDRKYPAFLYVHGGPHPFYTYGFTMEHQCFAAAGFGVMFCNPRGSSGYGALHQNFARAEDGSAYYDCLQFVDEAVRRNGWIDGERLGVTGGSYGGYMTNYMATHSRRFRAYITQRCVSSELIMYGSSDMHSESKGYDTFEAFMLEGLKKSTVSYAEKIDRPFLILQGEEDYRTPMEGAHQLFVAIKDVHPDLPVKLVIYPHTSHDQPSHPKLLMHYYQEMLEWFRKYL